MIRSRGGETIYLFLHIELFQRLLNKVITILNYQIEATENPRSAAKAKLDSMGFKTQPESKWILPFQNTS